MYGSKKKGMYKKYYEEEEDYSDEEEELSYQMQVITELIVTYHSFYF